MQRKMKNLLTGTLPVAMILTVISASGFAHQGATGIIKQRMDTMSEMADDMKSMGAMVKGKRAFDITVVRLAVERLSKHATDIPQQFPDTAESKNFHMTEALPEVWISKDRFNELADQLKSQIEVLKTLTHNDVKQAEFRKAFIKATKACSACHDDFRKPED